MLHSASSIPNTSKSSAVTSLVRILCSFTFLSDQELMYKDKIHKSDEFLPRWHFYVRSVPLHYLLENQWYDRSR